MDILSVATSTAMQAGILSLDLADKLTVKSKAPNDWVTNADTACEEFIIKEIKKHFPDHGILGEESSDLANFNPEDLAKKEYFWIIDPIDGTKNYARQLPIYGISIGVFKRHDQKKSKNFHYIAGEMVAAAIYIPRLSELFYAEKGEGAFLNNRQIHVSKTRNLKDGILATGFPPNNLNLSLKYFGQAARHSAGIRRMGAASVDLCYVAAGRLDAFWEFDLKPWDIAAGALIVTEAGGTLSDTNGNPLDLFGGDIMASNGHLHPKMINLFAKLR